jgi:hypothetical protein
MQTLTQRMNSSWQTCWKMPVFRKKTFLGLALLAVILSGFPFFFNSIEKRDGVKLDDWLLIHIPALNLSVPIFLLIWSTVLLAFLRVLKNPRFFLLLLWGYIILCLCRILTITLVPLNPPERLLELVDPLSNRFYGSHFITKDLFYSGHTATLFLIFLCLPEKWEKTLALLSTVGVALMLLFQHVHYTIDIIFAPPFAYGCFWLGQRISAKID